MKLTNKLISHKTTKHSWLLPNLFAIVFVMAQVASISHKAEHLSPDAENNCLLCINSVDHAINANTIEITLISADFIQAETQSIFFVDLATTINYSSRAPPLA